MMVLLSKLVTGLAGPYFTALTLPALILALVISLHHNFKQRDERIETAATQTCNQEWEAAIAKQERDAANASLKAAQEILEGERQINQGLRDELDKINVEYVAARERLAAVASDPRCLSDSVLDALRRRQSLGGGDKAGGSRQGRAK